MREEIIKELKLELCRRDFYEFCRHMDKKFFSDGKPHLKKIAYAMQDLYEGKIRKLAISLPPRAGKSYVASLFCCWIFGKDNSASIMRNSYGSKLAEKFSREIRSGLLQEPKFKEVFPNCELGDLQNVENWCLKGNTLPNYFCAGVGGSITGLGCKTLAILDDPIKNIEEALSETVIQNTFDWYTSTHLSRMETGCKELHIATRWSKKDPIGRLTDPYSESYIEDMKTIVIPALDENGKSFCEERKTTEEYYELRKVTDEFIWEAEFMQNPVDEKGLLFPPSELNWFSMKEIATKKPDGIFGYTDTADEGKDYVASATGLEYGNDVYITDVVFTQDGVEITEPLVADMIIRNKLSLMKIESNNGGYQYARNVRDLIEHKSKCTIISEHTSQNKETRILMQSGFVKKHFYFRDDYEPGSDYDKFMRAFTSYVKLSKNQSDDSPDCITGISEMCEMIVPELVEPERKKLPWALDTEYEDLQKGEYISWI